MKTAILALFAIGIAASLQAQAPVADSATDYTPEQLDDLVAPIALYPDALVALILPASTAPSDIVLATRYIQANGDPNQIASQPWDDSVKALTNYPEVLEWMNDNLDWTSALGRAFLQQSVEVMQSIQQLRALARANGTLVDTPQQSVQMSGSTILIVPTTLDGICVPVYDPDVVFSDSPADYNSPIIVFSLPYRVGPWLYFECDWDDFGVWRGTWQRGWAYRRDWRQPGNAAARGGFWRPDNVHQRELLRTVNRPVALPPHPRLMAGAPTVARRSAEAPTVAQRNAEAPTVAQRNVEAPTVAQRSAQSYRPSTPVPSSRPDPRGWRLDGNGGLAAQVQPSGPQITLSTSAAATPIRPVPRNVNPAPTEPTPIRQPQNINPAPIAPAPMRPAPVIRSAPAAPASPPPSGALFGGYTRGTDAQNFSNRGQASRAAASPPPMSRPAPAPAPRPAPAPEPRSAPPPSGGGSNSNQRNQR